MRSVRKLNERNVFIKLHELINDAADYGRGGPKRIRRFMKVYAFAEAVGERERLSSREMEILRASAGKDPPDTLYLA